MEPKDVERKGFRLTLNLKAQYRRVGDIEFRDCYIINISETGMAIETKTHFSQGDKLEIIFSLRREQSSFKGIVAYSLGKEVGLQFEEFSEEARENLRKYVQSTMFS